MSIRSKTADVKQQIELHRRGRSAVPIIFKKVRDAYYIIQSSVDYTYESYLHVEESEYDELSFIVDNSIMLLLDNDSMITITESGDKVTFKQGDITLTFKKAAGEYVKTPKDGWVEMTQMSTAILKSDVKEAKAFLDLASDLQVGVPAVLWSRGIMYTMYSNMIALSKVYNARIDLSMPYSAFVNITKGILESSVRILTHEKNGLLQFLGKSFRIVTSYKKPDTTNVDSLDKILNKMEDVGTFDLSAIEDVLLLYKCFPREKVTIVFNANGTVGLSLFTANGKHICCGTLDDIPVLTADISTSQLSSLQKYLKDDTKNIILQKGDSIICLKTPDMRTLLISGMIY